MMRHIQYAYMHNGLEIRYKVQASSVIVEQVLLLVLYYIA